MVSEDVEVLDLKGLRCPLPVLKVRKVLKSRAAGSQIWLETTDPLAVVDIPAYCNESGNMLLVTDRKATHCRFLVQKGASPSE